MWRCAAAPATARGSGSGATAARAAAAAPPGRRSGPSRAGACALVRRTSQVVAAATDGGGAAAAQAELLRGAASDDEQQRGAAAAIPPHWEQQIRTAPLGRRRVLQRYVRAVTAINALEPGLRALSDAQLAAQTLRFRDALSRNTHRLAAALDELLPEAFATVREASRRVLGLRHYDSQLVGGMVLHEGQVAEMATGEGKTLVAVLAAYLNALPSTLANPPALPGAGAGAADAARGGGPRRRAGGVHVITVNDYLAARDAEWMGKIYRFLGLTVGAVQSSSPADAARGAYACHVTYVTGQELCFNYLKDNTAHSAAELMLPDALGFAIVDEADSILIDESRNPMIISQPRGDTCALVATVDQAVRRLWGRITRAVDAAAARQPARPRAAVEAEVKARYLVLDAKQRSLSLSQEGMALLFVLLSEQPGVAFRAAAREGRAPTIMDLWEDDVPWGNMAITALKAYQYFAAGVQYIVRGGGVVIVDESTGRVRPISRYSGGLHQALEAKEGVEVRPDSHATASITFQVFFRFYAKLAGMTGTARSAAAEFYEIYGLRVVPIPTNKPPRRADLPLRLYYTETDKLAYMVSVVESCWAEGRPVLIGTSSVNESEAVLDVLQGWCRPAFRQLAARVQLLNAKPENVRLEAQVVAQAGLPAAVTIATNMAGRGTDIILGGNPEGLTRMGLLRMVYRRLLPRLAPCRVDAAGGAEARAASCELDALCPALPLDVFAAYDAAAVADIQPRSAAQAAAGLPRELHLALLAAMMLAELGGAGLQQDGVSHDDLRQLASAALSAADVVRRTTLRGLRESHGHAKLQELDFSSVVAPRAEAVFDELQHTLAALYMGRTASLAGATPEEDGADGAPRGGSSPAGGPLGRLGPALEQLQVFGSKAALLLWLWFDQQCEAMAEQVVAAGGLLVLGTSLQEGERIELQLRGRAGRQGDPGTTQLLFDVSDPLIANFGMQTFQQLAGSLLSSGQLAPYQESVVVDLLHREVQKGLENQWQMARLETKKYDEVLEAYRRNLYSLRRLILTGDGRQRSRVVNMFIQQWADALVAALIDPGAGPAAWTRESLDAAAVLSAPPSAAGAAAAAAAARAGGAGACGSAGGSSGGSAMAPQRVSPLAALMWHCHRLVNPPELLAGGAQVEFRARADDDAVAHDATARALFQLSQAAAPSSSGVGGAHRSAAARAAPLPLGVAEVAVLTPQQLQQLAAYLTQGAPLPWPEPHLEGGLSTRLALAAHAKLFGTPAAAACGAGSEAAAGRGGDVGVSAPLQLHEQAGAAAGLLGTSQRPPLRGRHAARAGVLRNYLGTALVHAYELRHLSLRKLLLSARTAGGGGGGALLDLDAELYLSGYCRSVMLEWIDALWSCFLEDVDKMRHAVGLKAYSSQQPLDEFRLEANRAFLVLLDSYRDAVVGRLMAPDLSFGLLLDPGQPPAAAGEAPGGGGGAVGASSVAGSPLEHAATAADDALRAAGAARGGG
ncbi:secA [Scenedesmus sp. PABB004]|nr:secA [Scenedesmus sp. PABB004]